VRPKLLAFARKKALCKAEGPVSIELFDDNILPSMECRCNSGELQIQCKKSSNAV